MAASFLLVWCLFGTWAHGLPDFSDLVSNTPPPTPENEEFVFSPFFEIYSGVPPIVTIAPGPPLISIPNPTILPTPSSPPNALPTLLPTRAPSEQAVPTMEQPPVIPPTPVVVSATRKMSYQYHWRGKTEGCQYKAPRALLQCLDGGILLVDKLSNADCEALALDVVRCSQIDQGSDATVDFDCVGMKLRHLAVKTTTLPSDATDCAAPMGPTRGGSARAAASLGRFCKNPSTGEVSLDTSFSCKGNSTASSTKGFCTSLNQCTGMTCAIVVDPIAITASNEDNACSEPETRQDLTNFQFNPSLLASYHLVKWTYSDRAFNCDWQVPDIQLRCENGGTIQMIQQVPFCVATGAGDTVICTNPNPESAEGRIIVELDFWCFGDHVEQLILEARTLEVDTSQFVCQPGGLIVQGLDVSRGCGDFNTNTFTLIKTPSFCKDLSQFRDDICFAGFSCPAGTADCLDVSVDPVSADSSSLVVGACFVAEQLS